MNTASALALALGIAGAAAVLVPASAGAQPPSPPPLSDLAFLPGDATLAPAAGNQRTPEIARGGDGYLAVWVDDRTSLTSIPNITGGPYGNPFIGSMWDIYAARLDAEGNPIDEAPIVVAQQILNQGMPDVAWNGENWLVVWSGQEGLSCCPKLHIYAARVSPAGAVLDDPPITVDIDPTSNGLYWPCVGSDGTNWVAVWRDLDDAAGIFTLDGARIAPDGTVLDPGGVRLRRDAYNSYPVDPDLVFAGDEFLLVWTEDSGEIAGQRLTLDLQRIGNVFRINTYGPTEGTNPRAATDGTDFLVTWWEDRYYGYSQLFGARVSHGGTVLDPSGIEITPYAGYTNFTPAVDWDGTNYIVAYNKGTFTNDMYATRVAPDGTVLDPAGILISAADGYQLEPAVAARSAAEGGGAVVVWEDPRVGGAFPRDVMGVVLGGDGTIVGAERVLSLGPPRQTLARIVQTGGAGYAVVFRSETSATVRILLQRVDAAGVSLDLEPIEVATGGSELTSPAVGWNGSVFLVAWENRTQNQVYARRVGADGVPIEPAPINPLPGNTPDVAALGDDFLVVSSHEPTNHIRYPKGVRVRGSDGAVLGPVATIGGSYSTVPRAAAFGGRWLVVWQQNPTHDNPRANVYASFVGADGMPAGSFQVIYDAVNAARVPMAAVADGDTAMIAWEDNRINPSELDVYVRRVLADGTLLDGTGFRVTSAPNSQFGPSIAWDGEEFVAAFGDFRNDGPYDQHRGDLYGARVTASRELLDPNGFAISNESVPEMLAAVAGGAGGAGRAILAGSIFRDGANGAPYVAYRIGYRMMGDGGAAGVDAELAAGAPAFALLGVAPNPARGPASVSFTLDRAGRVRLTVYDVQGRAVRDLAGGRFDAGEHRIAWDGLDGAGRAAPAGAYFIRLDAGAGREATKKLLRR